MLIYTDNHSLKTTKKFKDLLLTWMRCHEAVELALHFQICNKPLIRRADFLVLRPALLTRTLVGEPQAACALGRDAGKRTSYFLRSVTFPKQFKWLVLGFFWQHHSWKQCPVSPCLLFHYTCWSVLPMSSQMSLMVHRCWRARALCVSGSQCGRPLRAVAFPCPRSPAGFLLSVILWVCWGKGGFGRWWLFRLYFLHRLDKDKIFLCSCSARDKIDQKEVAEL